MVDAQTQTVLFETPLLEHRRAQRTGRVTLRLRSDEDVVGVRKLASPHCNQLPPTFTTTTAQGTNVIARGI